MFMINVIFIPSIYIEITNFSLVKNNLSFEVKNFSNKIYIVIKIIVTNLYLLQRFMII